MKIFVINGFPGAGKDTFCKMCEEVYPNTYQIWTSTPAKQALRLLGWNGEKTPEARKCLAELMNSSEQLFDGPFKYIRQELSGIQEHHPDAAVFIHSREARNITRYKDTFGAQSILVNRPCQEPLSNVNDRDVRYTRYDIIIDNTKTLAELREQAHAFVEVYLKGEALL